MPKTCQIELKDIVERDPLAPMDELSKELVWKFRYQTFSIANVVHLKLDVV